MTLASLKSRYRKTVAGFLWVVLNPLIIFGVHGMIFRRVLQIDTPKYSVFLLSGLLPWLFISQTLDMTTGTFVGSGPVLKSFRIHPLVFLISTVLDNLINFAAAFLVLCLPLAFIHHLDPVGLLLIVPSIAVLVLGVFGMSWLVATLHSILRDTKFVLTFALNIGFFLTPIFYPPERLPAEFRFLPALNPLFLLIAPFRSAIFEYDLRRYGFAFAQALGVALLMVAAAALLWRRKEHSVYLSI